MTKTADGSDVHTAVSGAGISGVGTTTEGEPILICAAVMRVVEEDGSSLVLPSVSREVATVHAEVGVEGRTTRMLG